MKQGAVDFGLEITQTGSAIANYGLHIVDELMNSEAGIWANPALLTNPAKLDLARMFLLNLYGSIYAENKVLLTFNAKKSDVEKLLVYLREHRLFGDEPTMKEGVHFTEFTISSTYEQGVAAREGALRTRKTRCNAHRNDPADRSSRTQRPRS